MSLTVSFQVTVPTNTPERPYYRRQTPRWKQEKPRWMKLPTDAKTSIVIMQVRIVRIELTTKDWKSPILPLNYIRMRIHEVRLELTTPSSVAKCSIQLSYPCIWDWLPAVSSGIERRSITSMPQWTTNAFHDRSSKYGEQDSNLHEISLITSLVLRDYQFHHLRIKGWFPTPTIDRIQHMNNIHDIKK